MSELYAIVKQDFAAAMVAWHEADYSSMNMYANRLMGNCVFGANKEYAVVGFFQKDLAIDCLRLANNSDLQNALKPFASAFLATLDEALKPEVDLAQVWQAYFAYVDSTRKLYMQSAEKQVYKDNKTFSSEALSVLAGELLNGAYLFQEQGWGTKGFLHEAERIIRVHGADERDLVLCTLITSLDRLVEYIKFGCSSQDVTCVKAGVTPWMERIREWVEKKEGVPYRSASELLAAILVEWRLCFVRFGELGRISSSEERKIELPAEAKKRLGNTIAEALRKDLGKTKK